MKKLLFILQLILCVKLGWLQLAGVYLNRQVLESWNFYLNSVSIKIDNRRIVSVDPYTFKCVRMTREWPKWQFNGQANILFYCSFFLFSLLYWNFRNNFNISVLVSSKFNRKYMHLYVNDLKKNEDAESSFYNK